MLHLILIISKHIRIYSMLERIYSFQLVGKRLALFAVIVFFHTNLYAQVCSELLNKAENEFEAGHLYEIPGLLKDCLDKGFTKEEKIRANRLLTITYLYLDQLNNADESYLKLLKLDPEFKPNPLIDPAELFYLHENFITNPFFTLNLIRIGTNFTFNQVIHDYTSNGGNVLQIEEDIYQKYIPLGSFSIGSGIEYGINDNFSFGSDITLSLKKFQFKEGFFNRTEELTFNENQWWIDIPFYLKFNLPDVKFKPYVFGGFDVGLLFYTSANNPEALWVRKTNTTEPDLKRFKDVNLQINEQRRFFNYGILYGAGIKHKIGINYLSFEVRYLYGLTNLSVTKAKFPSTNYQQDNDSNLFYQFGYVGDDIKSDNFMITINYVKPIYKPRKKKR